MEIVSSNSDQDLERKRAEWMARDAVRELAANIIRVVRGAGRPHEIGRQAAHLVGAMQAHFDSARYWPFDEIADELRYQEREWLSTLPSDQRAIHYAERMIIAGALQMTASDLLGQRTQETMGHHEMYEGLNELGRLREEERKKWAVPKTRPAVPKARKKPKPNT